MSDQQEDMESKAWWLDEDLETQTWQGAIEEGTHLDDTRLALEVRKSMWRLGGLLDAVDSREGLSSSQRTRVSEAYNQKTMDVIEAICVELDDPQQAWFRRQMDDVINRLRLVVD